MEGYEKDFKSSIISISPSMMHAVRAREIPDIRGYDQRKTQIPEHEGRTDLVGSSSDLKAGVLDQRTQIPPWPLLVIATTGQNDNWPVRVASHGVASTCCIEKASVVVTIRSLQQKVDDVSTERTMLMLMLC